MHILLVDDERELTDPLTRILTREGYQVDVAHDGQEGSQMAAAQQYDLMKFAKNGDRKGTSPQFYF
jgi:two-component system, OmpR family, manganese sensing response regulator